MVAVALGVQMLIVSLCSLSYYFLVANLIISRIDCESDVRFIVTKY
jgi:hypothetical protein